MGATFYLCVFFTFRLAGCPGCYAGEELTHPLPCIHRLKIGFARHEEQRHSSLGFSMETKYPITGGPSLPFSPPWGGGAVRGSSSSCPWGAVVGNTRPGKASAGQNFLRQYAIALVLTNTPSFSQQQKFQSRSPLKKKKSEELKGAKQLKQASNPGTLRRYPIP